MRDAIRRLSLCVVRIDLTNADIRPDSALLWGIPCETSRLQVIAAMNSFLVVPVHIGVAWKNAATTADTATYTAPTWGTHFDFIRTEEELNRSPSLFSAVHIRDVAYLVHAFEHRAAGLLVRTAVVAGTVPNALAGCAQWEGIRIRTR